MYFSMAFCSGTDSGYILPLDKLAPGSSSMAQSHGRRDGSLVALYSSGTSGCNSGMGLSVAVEETAMVVVVG